MLGIAPARAVLGTTCDVGLEALQRGEFDAARAAFLNPTTDPECSEAGLAILEARMAASAAALKECTTLLKQAESESDQDRDQTLEEASSRCSMAVSLDPGSEESRAELKKVQDLQAEADASETVTDDIERVSTESWDIVRRLLVAFGTWLVALAIALPLIALFQLWVGRVGRKRLGDIRTTLRRVPLVRLVAELSLAIALVGVLIGEGSFPDWAAWALGVPLAAIGIGGALFVANGAERNAWFLIPVAMGIVLVGAYQAASKGNAVIVVLAVIALLTLLAWVRAQTSSLRIGSFGDASGKIDPPSVFGPLVTAELVRLAKPGRTSIDIVDSPTTPPAFDADSLNALIGAESKLAGALSKILTALVRPSDYTLTGYLIEETSSGVGVTMQLKRGPRLLSAATLYAKDFQLATADAASADEGGATPDAAAKGKDDEKRKEDEKKDDTKATGAKHPELASAAACWVLASFTQELIDDVKSVRIALDGASDWRSVGYSVVGARELEAGDVKKAGRLYARAVDADRHNLPARFGLAQARARMPHEDESLRRSALDAAARDAVGILREPTEEGFPPPSEALRLRCAYLYIAALANARALEDNDDTRARLAIAIRQALIGPATPGTDTALVRAELEATLTGEPQPGDETGMALLREQIASSLAALQLEFHAPAPAPGILTDRAMRTIRGRYNLAAHRSLESVNDAGLRAAALELLTDAAFVPELAAFARTDPYFEPLQGDPLFEELVGEAETKDEQEGGELSAFILIGTDQARLLAENDIRSFEAIRAATVGEISDALGGEVPNEVIIRWKNAADLELVPGIGVRSLNLLVVAGVSSTAELAGRNADNLAAVLGSVAAALGRPTSPSAATVEAWIAAA